MDPDTTIKQLILQSMHRCVVCHRDHDITDIEILKRGDDFWTMVVECKDCHARNFVAAMVNPNDPQGTIRQMTEDAVAMANTFFERDPGTSEDRVETHPLGERVDAADVVDMHEFLSSFDGDFASLFRKPRG